MCNCRLPLDLQFFADGDGGGTDDGDGGGSAGEGAETGDNHLLSFDDFLKEQGNQAEFDRRVQKAVTTAVSNAQKKCNQRKLTCEKHFKK